jgi:radical SAM protein with 4Fe4S-binding SPASM domain
MGSPVLLFSGGAPTLRKDLFELGRLAIESGMRAVISSNGTTIDEEMAEKIVEVGFSYVGVSIDGAPETHDKFRGKKGAFEAAVKGISNCLAAGVKAGVRLTVNRENVADLPAVLDIVEKEGIPRFCMYHLVYAGRGENLVAQDLSSEEARGVIALLIDKVLDWEKRGVETEILTTDNHADGVMIESFVREHRPERLDDVRALQLRHGGCSAGKKMANVDYAGNVHPCQFWSGATLGNVRERPFSEIWTDVSNPLLAKLREMSEHLTGPRCSSCRHRATCGGCRIRAEVVSGDLWGDDPACYLTEEEIGVADTEREEVAR